MQFTQYYTFFADKGGKRGSVVCKDKGLGAGSWELGVGRESWEALALS